MESSRNSLVYALGMCIQGKIGKILRIIDTIESQVSAKDLEVLVPMRASLVIISGISQEEIREKKSVILMLAKMDATLCEIAARSSPFVRARILSSYTRTTNVGEALCRVCDTVGTDARPELKDMEIIESYWHRWCA